MADPSQQQRGKVAAPVALLLTSLIAGCGLISPESTGHANMAPIKSSPVDARLEDTNTVGPFGLVTVGSGPARPVGQPISATDDYDMVRKAIEQAHGPTNDVAAQMNRFGYFPPLGTPPRTEIVDLRSDVRLGDDSPRLHTSEVSIMVDGQIDQVSEFFRSEAMRLGWISVAAITTQTRGSRQTQYEVPGSEFPLPDAEIELWPVKAVGPANLPRSLVRIRYTTVETNSDIDIGTHYGSWVSTVPLPEGGEYQESSIQTSAVGRRSLHLTVSVKYLGVDAASLAQQVRVSMTQAGFPVSQVPTYGDKMDHWIYFESPQYDEARITLHEPTDQGMKGQWTVLKVDTRLTFDPYSDVMDNRVDPSAPLTGRDQVSVPQSTPDPPSDN